MQIIPEFVLFDVCMVLNKHHNSESGVPPLSLTRSRSDQTGLERVESAPKASKSALKSLERSQRRCRPPYWDTEKVVSRSPKNIRSFNSCACSDDSQIMCYEAFWSHDSAEWGLIV